MMRNVFFVPPLNKISGGLANIYDLAALLAESGREVALCATGRGAPGLAESGLPVVDFDALSLSAGDLWCIPEGWPNAIAKAAHTGATTLVYAQNWVYTLGVLPEGVRWNQLPVEYLAVSEPVAAFMRDILGLNVRRVLPPVIRECFFRPGARPKNRVRVAWMPRKNSLFARQIIQICEELLSRHESAPRVEYVEIANSSQEEVAQILSSSHIFISSVMAEGFGLPAAEAMASGCVPVGFTGLGGWEYMRSSPLSPVHDLMIPPFPLAERPWGPNGFYAPEGDVISAGRALAAAVRLAADNGPEWLALQTEALKTAQFYSREAMRARLEKIWNW